MNEFWRPINGYEGYEVSDHGRVRSYHTQVGAAFGSWRIAKKPARVMAGVYRSDNRYGVLIRSNGKNRFVQVANLVLEAFVEPKPDGLVVSHKDGDMRNNHLDNIEYTTRSQSVQNLKRSGYGQTNMDEDTIIAMRKEYARGIHIRDLVKKYKCCKTVVWTTCTGVVYKWAGGPITRKRRQFTDADIREMRRLRWTESMTLPQVAEIYNIDQSYVSLLVRGKRRLKAGGLLAKPIS